MHTQTTNSVACTRNDSQRTLFRRYGFARSLLHLPHLLPNPLLSTLLRLLSWIPPLSPLLPLPLVLRHPRFIIRHPPIILLNNNIMNTLRALRPLFNRPALLCSAQSLLMQKILQPLTQLIVQSRRNINIVPVGIRGNSIKRLKYPFLLCSPCPLGEISLIKMLFHLRIRIESTKEFVPKQPQCTENWFRIRPFRTEPVNCRIVSGMTFVNQGKRIIRRWPSVRSQSLRVKVTTVVVNKFSMLFVEALQKVVWRLQVVRELQWLAYVSQVHKSIKNSLPPSKNADITTDPTNRERPHILVHEPLGPTIIEGREPNVNNWFLNNLGSDLQRRLFNQRSRLAFEKTKFQTGVPTTLETCAHGVEIGRRHFGDKHGFKEMNRYRRVGINIALPSAVDHSLLIFYAKTEKPW